MAVSAQQSRPAVANSPTSADRTAPRPGLSVLQRPAHARKTPPRETTDPAPVEARENIPGIAVEGDFPPGALIDQPGYYPEPPLNSRPGEVFNFVQIDSYYSRRMLDFQNRQTDKQLLVLNDLAESGYPSLVLGAQLRASFLAAGTNRANKFSYLGRFPADFVGTSATDARLLQANMGATGHFGPMAHGFGELLFSDVFTFPTFDQGSFQVRQAYVVVGDPARSPLYAFIGKKNVSFGDMRTLSPFSQSVVWHYFGALAEGVGGGLDADNLHFTITGLNGGRGIRVADSSSRGQINNFAANGSFCLCTGPRRQLEFGGGYLHGTIYDAERPEHIEPDLFGIRNGAWDVNTNLRLGNWQFSGEFVSTLRPWLVTDSRVRAWRAETAVNIHAAGCPATLSASFSEGLQGQPGTQFEFNRQLVLGVGFYPNINTQFTFEYVHSSGFAPLIDITRVSDRNVHQHSFVLGVVLVL